MMLDQESVECKYSVVHAEGFDPQSYSKEQKFKAGGESCK